MVALAVAAVPVVAAAAVAVPVFLATVAKAQ
jgi:hypothetical protein